MSDGHSASYLKRAGPLVLARFFTAIVSVCVPLVLASRLSPTDYGSYKQLFLISQPLYFLLPFGIPQSLFFFVPRAERRRPWIGQSLLFMGCIGVLAGICLYAGLDQIASIWSNPRLLTFRGSLAVYVGALVASNGLEVSLTSRGATRSAAVVYLIADLSRAALLVLPILAGTGLGPMMWGLAGFAVVRAIAAWIVGLWGTRGPIYDASLFRTQLTYAAPFGMAMLLTIPQMNAHQWAVSSTMTPEVVALYAVGCFQLPLVDLLYTPTSEVLMVRLGELDRLNRRHEGVDAFRQAAGKLAYVFLPMAAFLWAAAPEFIGALFPRRYIGAVPIFRVSVLGVVLATLPMDGALRALGWTRTILVASVVRIAVTVPALWFGIRSFGLLGAIGAWALAEVAGKAVLFVALAQALEQSPASLLPWSDLRRACMAAAGAAVGVILVRALPWNRLYALPEGLWSRALPLAALGSLFSIAYLLALRLAGVRPLALLASLRPRRSAG